MEFLPSPFRLTEFEDEIVQTRGFMFKTNPLKTENLENLILRVNGNTTDELNRRGILAELLAVDLFKEHMANYFSSENPFFEGNLISGMNGYVINSSKRHLLKLISENRVVILKRNKLKVDEKKFGFINIAEIDGLYMIKKIHFDKTKKKEKKLVVIETKSSDARINPIHISEDIILPLSKMYQMPISYLLVGFKDEVYKDEQSNILNNHLRETYFNLRELGHEFNVIHFPFKKEEFNVFTSKFESQRSKVYTGKAKYFENEARVEIYLPDGKILTGNFIPEIL